RDLQHKARNGVERPQIVGYAHERKTDGRRKDNRKPPLVAELVREEYFRSNDHNRRCCHHCDAAALGGRHLVRRTGVWPCKRVARKPRPQPEQKSRTDCRGSEKRHHTERQGHWCHDFMPTAHQKGGVSENRICSKPACVSISLIWARVKRFSRRVQNRS